LPARTARSFSATRLARISQYSSAADAAYLWGRQGSRKGRTPDSLLGFVKQVDGLLYGRFLQPFAAAAEALIELDGRVLHPFVRFLRAAHQEEMLGPGQALVSILVIEADAEEAKHLWLAVLFGLA